MLQRPTSDMKSPAAAKPLSQVFRSRLKSGDLNQSLAIQPIAPTPRTHVQHNLRLNARIVIIVFT